MSKPSKWWKINKLEKLILKKTKQNKTKKNIINFFLISLLIPSNQPILSLFSYLPPTFFFLHNSKRVLTLPHIVRLYPLTVLESTTSVLVGYVEEAETRTKLRMGGALTPLKTPRTPPLLSPHHHHHHQKKPAHLCNVDWSFFVTFNPCQLNHLRTTADQRDNDTHESEDHLPLFFFCTQFTVNQAEGIKLIINKTHTRTPPPIHTCLWASIYITHL